MRRGEVWVARLNPNQGVEVGKVRPVVVIQADALTEAGIATLLVVPLTSQRRHGAEALRVLIPARDRLLRECWAMAEQPRALDRNRISEAPLIRLSAAAMAVLKQELAQRRLATLQITGFDRTGVGVPLPQPSSPCCCVLSMGQAFATVASYAVADDLHQRGHGDRHCFRGAPSMAL